MNIVGKIDSLKNQVIKMNVGRQELQWTDFQKYRAVYREYIDKNFEEKLNNLILRDSDGEEAVINISELYADLLQRSIEESVSFEEKQETRTK